MISGGRRPNTCRVLVGTTVVLALSLLLFVSYYVPEGMSSDEYYSVTSKYASEDTGVYNFTVVTAMLDIGRGSWSAQKRSYDDYLSMMEHVLRLHMNLIIFVDKRGREHVEKTNLRKGREAHTRIFEVTLQDLPDYKHKDRVAEIMASEVYRKDNVQYQHRTCESIVPEYDIIQWSKLYFMNRSVELDPFNTDLFIWLDGGYSHGDPRAGGYPRDGIFEPNDKILQHMHQMTFIEREPVEKYRQDSHRLHKMNIAIIVGSFFAGGKQAFRRLHVLQRELIADWLKKGEVVDDDQTTYMLMYYREPELFNLVPGDWFDVFKLFNKRYQPWPP